MIRPSLKTQHRARRRPSLMFDDAVEIWKRHFLLGEDRDGIAQAFGVTRSRIDEILDERSHIGSRRSALGENPLRANYRFSSSINRCRVARGLRS
jgi:hypothetical protein